MRRNLWVVCLLIAVFFLTAISSSEAATRKATGTVVAIDPDGKAIVISEKLGKEELVIGAIVTPETTIKVGGKTADLSQIKVGDRVTLVYERTEDLYAKEILKK
jgi:Cu/Ag efflux protein CusF